MIDWPSLSKPLHFPNHFTFQTTSLSIPLHFPNHFTFQTISLSKPIHSVFDNALFKDENMTKLWSFKNNAIFYLCNPISRTE